MVKHSQIYLFLLGVLVAQSIQGCANPTTQATSTPASIPTASTTPAFIPVTDTPTPLVPFREDSSCWSVMPLKKGGYINGSLLFGSSNPAHIFAWDVSSFQAKTLDKSAQTDWVVSPDGKVIASMPYNENKLVLTSSSQSKVFLLPKGDYGGVMEILANGDIVIIGNTPDFWVRNYVNGAGLTVPYYIFDPITGNLKDYSVFLSGFTVGVQGSYPFAFSPDMHFVVYNNTPHNGGGDRYTLLDLKTGKIVWEEPKTPASLYTADSFPAWKPNTDTLTYILWSDWYNGFGNYFSVSLDGAVTQLTKFDQTTLINPGRGGLLLPSWSPDGRFMAFRIVQPGQSSLYIWDDQEKMAYKPCLPEENKAYSDYDVYWYFDSNHLFLRLAYPNPQPPGTPTDLLPATGHIMDLILDMTTKTILELPDENNRGGYTSHNGPKVPLGWINWEIP